MFPGSAGGDVAAVKEDISILGQGIAPSGHGVAFLLQRRAVQPGVPQVDLPVGPVGDEMDSRQVRSLCEDCADLLEAVAVGFENHDLYDPIVITPLQVGDQLLVTLHVFADKNQLAHLSHIHQVWLQFGTR